MSSVLSVMGRDGIRRKAGGRVEEAVTQAPTPGERIMLVKARGKHLLLHFDGGLTLRTHLCLSGALTGKVIEDVLERAARLAPAGTTLGEALLDQRIAAGIGNVYKSEACFAVGIDPGTPIEHVDEATRRRVWSVAARQLQANLGHAERRTHPAGLAVYGHRGQPCHRCGTPVRMTRHGDQARSTYWCPTCQPMPSRPNAP